MKFCIIIDEYNVITSIARCNNDNHVPFINGIVLDIEDVNIDDVVGRYRLENKNITKLTDEEIAEYEANKIDNCLDDLKQQKVKDSKTQLELWLTTNPIFSTVHNPQGEYYTVTYEKQSLLTRNLLLAQLSQSEITTWNSTANICEEWSVTELSQLALEIEEYVRPKITKQQRYEVEINACVAKEELDKVVFDYECI